MEEMACRWIALEERIAAACIRAGRARDSVRLVAVTKTRPLEQVRSLIALGMTDAAENRVQDARERIPQLADAGLTWHFIGRLQTNKAKYLPGLVQWIHSVDRVEILEALEQAFAARGETARVLLQGNTGGEAQKAGGAFDETRELLMASQKCRALKVTGLMTMAPYAEDPEDSRPCFSQLREWRDALAEEFGLSLPELSMGMSGDFEVAIEEGATLVRVGSVLFEE